MNLCDFCGYVPEAKATVDNLCPEHHDTYYPYEKVPVKKAKFKGRK